MRPTLAYGAAALRNAELFLFLLKAPPPPLTKEGFPPPLTAPPFRLPPPLPLLPLPFPCLFLLMMQQVE